MTDPSDADVIAMSQHPLHAVWCAGGDASNSPDFRDPDGVLDEAAYVRYGLNVMRRVYADVEAEVRAKVAAEIRATSDQIAVRAEVSARVKAGTADEHPLLVGLEFADDLVERVAAAAYTNWTGEDWPAGEEGAFLRAVRAKWRAHAKAVLAVLPGPSAVAQDVAAFHAHIGSPPWDGPVADMPAATIDTRNRLVREECDELIAATEQGDVVGIADACADLVYVAYGTAFTYGIPLDRVLAEVHRSNMTKDPGPPGKAVKGGRYSPPDVAGVLAERSTKEML